MKEVEYRPCTKDNGLIGSHYDVRERTIYLSSKFQNHEMLSDDEVLTVTGDTLIHEYMHHLMYNNFGETVSKLFDAIGHLFYKDYELSNKVLKQNLKGRTWKDTIEESGLQYFFDRYAITADDLNYARYVCRNRLD